MRTLGWKGIGKTRSEHDDELDMSQLARARWRKAPFTSRVDAIDASQTYRNIRIIGQNLFMGRGCGALLSFGGGRLVEAQQILLLLL